MTGPKPRRNLDETEVAQILQRYRDGAKKHQLADEFGVEVGAIRHQLRKHSITKYELTKPPAAEPSRPTVRRSDSGSTTYVGGGDRPLSTRPVVYGRQP